jgi:hypothetical protein
MSRPQLLLRFVTSVCAASFVAAGCGDDKASMSMPPPLPPGTPTYADDIAPILNAKCVKCHQEGGIGSFRMDRYANVAPMTPAILAMTKAGLMPPYLVTHDGTCGQFDDSETISADQIAKIEAWDKAGRPEGRMIPPAMVAPQGLAQGLDFKTPNLAPVAQGGDFAKYDEYRCFVVEGGVDRDRFITGYDVIPGNPLVVHHVVASLVEPTRMTRSGKTNAQLMKELDDKDPDRPGYACLSPAGERVEPDAIPVVWAPGQGPTFYPDKMGVPHKPGHVVVIQMHYNLADPKAPGMTDVTTVRFRHADSVDRRLFFLIEDPFLNSAFGMMPKFIPPGAKAHREPWALAGKDVLGPLPYVDVVGIMPHMHERGVRKELRFVDGSNDQCVVKVDRWDFNWQKFYFYKGTLPRITPTTELQMVCEYDTTKDTMPVLPGWGTRNEMCIAILMLALPPGA